MLSLDIHKCNVQCSLDIISAIIDERWVIGGGFEGLTLTYFRKGKQHLVINSRRN